MTPARFSALVRMWEKLNGIGANEDGNDPTGQKRLAAATGKFKRPNDV